MNDAASETQTIASTNNDKSRKTSTVLDEDLETRKSEKNGDDLDSDDDEKSFLALALDSRGLWLYTNLCEPDKLHDGYYAIGTGAQAACEAMRRGDTPAQAVKAAMRWDECTGGKVTELHLTQHGKTISKKAKKATPVKGEAKPGNTGRVEPSVEADKETTASKG